LVEGDTHALYRPAMYVHDPVNLWHNLGQVDIDSNRRDDDGLELTLESLIGCEGDHNPTAGLSDRQLLECADGSVSWLSSGHRRQFGCYEYGNSRTGDNGRRRAAEGPSQGLTFHNQAYRSSLSPTAARKLEERMAIRIVRLGSPRVSNEGLRVGTVRRPPRGVPKAEYATRDLYDVWFPELAPSEALLKEGLTAADDKAWRRFIRRYRAEMKTPQAGHALSLLAALSHHTNLSVGCYCERFERCHRSVLAELLADHGADLKHS
jgi:uncharacterized protein YeaO (DUF488 family)